MRVIVVVPVIVVVVNAVVVVDGAAALPGRGRGGGPALPDGGHPRDGPVAVLGARPAQPPGARQLLLLLLLLLLWSQQGRGGGGGFIFSEEARVFCFLKSAFLVEVVMYRVRYTQGL